MQIYMRVCPICAKENKRDSGRSVIYVPGWINFYNYEPDENETCDYHKDQKLIKCAMTCEEFQILRYVSNDPSFMQAMEDLKQKNPIEYQLKLSQFKTQLAQIQKTKEESNKIHCPKCNSTAITSGARGVNSFWGLIGASKTVNRCGNCGYTWKP